jgi:hypothetical protein
LNVRLPDRKHLIFALAIATACVGCRQLEFPRLRLPFTPRPIEVPVSNPLDIGVIDEDFLWRMIVDTVDDHFRIDVEQPISVNGAPEGNLVTYPEISGTSLEPWRRDTARGFERLQSTFQTIRRTASVRVIRQSSGYRISVEVVKEQEDVDQSQFAAAGASSQRHDGTVIRMGNEARQMPLTLGWYEIGRDLDLERRILEGILGRITNVEAPRKRLH